MNPIRKIAGLFGHFSAGVWLIVLMFLITGPIVLLRPMPQHDGLEFWLISPAHAVSYRGFIREWNERESTIPLEMRILDTMALERRMLSGFQAGTPIADLIEVERNMIGRVFGGPEEAIGFVDLTDILKEEGIYERINEPSYSAWTSRGRIYGIPHDVHPVLLAYRADIVEAAGIDLSTVETWDELWRALRPLMGDGPRPTRFPLNLWHTQGDVIEALLLQAGGALFDADGRLTFTSEINVHVIATIATWLAGPGRIAADAPRFTAAGNQMVLDGTVIATIMPDWLAGVWLQDIPGLAGKVKLMPLPAWEPGGRRTSVMGGTMLGVTKASEQFEQSWQFAKELYLSADLAERLFRENHIVSPVIEHWSLPFYHQPSDFFSGQRSGSFYLEAAPEVPLRSSSPYNTMAVEALTQAVLGLFRLVNARNIDDPQAIYDAAREALQQAENRIRRQMDRNIFQRIQTTGEAP